MQSVAAPVAVYDSGVGGIGVLRELKKQLPFENFLYFGDSANAPYGEKSTAEILRIVVSRAERLLCRAKALVLACNTATAVAAETLRHGYDLPVIGMEPALRPALSAAPHPKILVLATEVTLREEKFAALLQSVKGEAEVFPLPAPGIVRLVEAGITCGKPANAYLCRLLEPFRGEHFDAIVLGCTHFPFMREELARVIGYPVPFFDGISGTVAQTIRRLTCSGLLTETAGASPGWAPGRVVFATSRPETLPLCRRLFSLPQEFV